MSDQSKAAIIALIIAAGFVGFLLVGRNKKDSPNSSTVNVNQGTTDKKVSSEENSAQVQKLLTTDLGTDVTGQKAKEFAKNVMEIAIDTQSMSISNCRGTPAIAKVKLGQNLMVKNMDAKAHVLKSGEDTILEIEANAEKSIKPSFVHGVGVYGFACDENSSVGIFQVVE